MFFKQVKSNTVRIVAGCREEWFSGYDRKNTLKTHIKIQKVLGISPWKPFISSRVLVPLFLEKFTFFLLNKAIIDIIKKNTNKNQNKDSSLLAESHQLPRNRL